MDFIVLEYCGQSINHLVMRAIPKFSSRVQLQVLLERAVSDAIETGGPLASAKERESLQNEVASCVRAMLGLLSCQLPPADEDEMTKKLLQILKNGDSIFTTDARLNLTLAMVKLAWKKQAIGDIIVEVGS